MLKGIKHPDVKTYDELEKIECPQDTWIVYVEDEKTYYYYDGDKRQWIDLGDHNDRFTYVTYENNSNLVSSKIMFHALDLNEIFLTTIIMSCVMFALYCQQPEVASMLAGILAGRFTKNYEIDKKNKET